MLIHEKIKKLIRLIIKKFKPPSIHAIIINNHFTMVSIERLINLQTQCLKFAGTNYSFVECGVAKGGCLALMKYSAGVNNKIFGFDSFEGMPEITPMDIADQIPEQNLNINNPKHWVDKNLSGGIENVFKTFSTLKINTDNVLLVNGFLKDTLNVQSNIDKIENIAVLRLDVDWYESTKLCLEKLYNKVVICGVILIDDYGCWIGAKRAVDEFRELNMIHSPLLKTDNDEFYWIKTTETELCKLGYKYSVDKSPYFGSHTYTPQYHKILESIRNEIKICVEIGIGNTQLMKPLTNKAYKIGASLRMWRDYFPNAQIIGADILENVLFNEDRITTYLLDQSNVKSLEGFSDKIGNNVDLIIDDGSHIQEHMIVSFTNLWKNIRPNGMYIIEDINILFFDRIFNLNTELNLPDADCILAYKGNFAFDNLIIFQKK